MAHDKEAYLSLELLKSKLDYCPISGQFTWLVSCGVKKAGDSAGCIKTNKYGLSYLSIQIDKQSYYAHRLAWFYFYGKWPLNHIDHQDHNGLNNNINNLRDVNCIENSKNQSISSRNKSGFIGITKYRKQWKVQITSCGKQIHIGYFRTIDDAISARKLAESKYNFHSNHGT